MRPHQPPNTCHKNKLPASGVNRIYLYTACSGVYSLTAALTGCAGGCSSFGWCANSGGGVVLIGVYPLTASCRNSLLQDVQEFKVVQVLGGMNSASAAPNLGGAVLILVVVV